MKTDKNTKWTALYERLSRDDDTFGDSVSIAHQKAYLRKYADEHGFANCHDYTDDGYSGGTFDRPAWNQMIADIEDGKVGTVIAKDMSRVGRDHLQTGFYTEIYFARNSVRFIAIDSRVDNQRSDSNEFAPILNVFNEMYLHDQSR
ncbi:MAG: recombinase family protein, partial [Clostridia bacterium]|nr:recombinase family protein [Clostridia bacterium]